MSEMDKLHAFMLALHPRVGTESPAALLGGWLAREVARHYVQCGPRLLTFAADPLWESMLHVYDVPTGRSRAVRPPCGRSTFLAECGDSIYATTAEGAIYSLLLDNDSHWQRVFVGDGLIVSNWYSLMAFKCCLGRLYLVVSPGANVRDWRRTDPRNGVELQVLRSPVVRWYGPTAVVGASLAMLETDNQNRRARIVEYDTAASKWELSDWTELPSQTRVSAFSQLVSLGELLYMVSIDPIVGVSGISHLFLWRRSDCRFEQRATLSVGSYWLSFGSWDGRFLIAKDHSHIGVMHLYDPAIDAWSIVNREEPPTVLQYPAVLS